MIELEDHAREVLCGQNGCVGLVQQTNHSPHCDEQTERVRKALAKQQGRDAQIARKIAEKYAATCQGYRVDTALEIEAAIQDSDD
jgi:hypothetical protein